jgi:putative flippase GtrA
MRALLQASPLRYLIVGGVLFAVDLAVFLLLFEVLGVAPAVAQLAARGSGALIGFFAHRHYTFRAALPSPRFGLGIQGGGYLSVALATFFLSPVVLVLALDALGSRAIPAKIVTEAVLVTLTYLAMRFLFGRAVRTGS